MKERKKEGKKERKNLRFCDLRTPKSKLYPSVYPQIRIVSLTRTPKIKNSNSMSFFEWFLKFCVPSVSFSCTPRGTLTPG